MTFVLGTSIRAHKKLLILGEDIIPGEDIILGVDITLKADVGHGLCSTIERGLIVMKDDPC
jgi:hypothetical protein